MRPIIIGFGLLILCLLILFKIGEVNFTTGNVKLEVIVAVVAFIFFFVGLYLSGVIAMKPDNELDIATIKNLLQRIVKEIHSATNRVRYTMNGFVIGVGGYIKELTNEAIETAKKIRTVYVDMGGTACQVPSAADYIKKMEAKGSTGKKKKTVKCYQ